MMQVWCVQIRKGGSGSTEEVIAESAEAAAAGALLDMGPGWYVLGDPWVKGSVA